MCKDILFLFTNLNSMAFIRVSGKQNIEYFPRAASQIFTNGALSYYNGSGRLIPADATSGDHAGIVMQTVTAADSDYTSQPNLMVDIPAENDIFSVGCTATALATLSALIGTYIDLTSSIVADVGNSSKDALLVVGVVSTTKILVKIASRSNILRTATT